MKIAAVGPLRWGYQEAMSPTASVQGLGVTFVIPHHSALGYTNPCNRVRALAVPTLSQPHPVIWWNSQHDMIHDRVFLLENYQENWVTRENCLTKAILGCFPGRKCPISFGIILSHNLVLALSAMIGALSPATLFNELDIPVPVPVVGARNTSGVYA